MDLPVLEKMLRLISLNIAKDGNIYLSNINYIKKLATTLVVIMIGLWSDMMIVQ
jgi:hypothetical protein